MLRGACHVKATNDNNLHAKVILVVIPKRKLWALYMIYHGTQLMGWERCGSCRTLQIPYAVLKRLRWRTLPAAKEATYYMGVNILSDRWTGSILGSSPNDLIDRHWFLCRYLVIFKVSSGDDVAATSESTSAGCQPHTSSIWPWSGTPKVHLYNTFLGSLRPTFIEISWPSTLSCLCTSVHSLTSSGNGRCHQKPREREYPPAPLSHQR